MQVSTEALTTLSATKAFLLRSDAADDLAEEVFTDGGDYDSEGVAGIESASEDVRTYLNRDLYVQKRTVLTTDTDFERVQRTPDADYPYLLKTHRVPDWPVLSVTEDVKIFGDRRIYAKDQTLDSVELWAGYRRDDLGATDYGVDAELSDAEIPLLPRKVEQVTKRIAVYHAFRKVKGLIGLEQTRQTFGQWEAEVSKDRADTSYVQRQLKTLHTYRSL